MGAIGILALGGMFTIHFNRYFTWIYPILICLQLIGLAEVLKRYRASLWLLGIMILGLHTAALADFSVMFSRLVAMQASSMQKIERMNQMLSSGTHLGSFGLGGLKYLCPDVYVMNQSGIDYAPLRDVKSASALYERYREDLQLRPDLFLITPRTPASLLRLLDPDHQPIPGIYLDEEWSLAHFDTDLLNADALSPLDSQIKNKLEGWPECDRLNIGYGPEEKRTAFQAFSALPQGISFFADLTTNTIDKVRFAEVIQPIAGSSDFTLQVTPGKPARLILRMASTMDAHVNGGFSNGSKIELDARDQVLIVKANGETIVTLQQNFEGSSMKEFCIDIPPQSSPQLQVSLIGLQFPGFVWCYTPLH
jgi:hypothetical protein